MNINECSETLYKIHRSIRYLHYYIDRLFDARAKKLTTTKVIEKKIVDKITVENRFDDTVITKQHNAAWDSFLNRWDS